MKKTFLKKVESSWGKIENLILSLTHWRTCINSEKDALVQLSQSINDVSIPFDEDNVFGNPSQIIVNRIKTKIKLILFSFQLSNYDTFRKRVNFEAFF